MIISRFFYFSLAIAGCTAAAYAIGRDSRHLEKRRQKEDLRTWEYEGGNLAPSDARAEERRQAPDRGQRAGQVRTGKS